MTPEERSLRGRIGAHALHSQVDGRQHTQPARDAFAARFERQVDPDGTLPPMERRRRAEHAKRAYMLSLALKSSQSRRQRRHKPKSFCTWLFAWSLPKQPAGLADLARHPLLAELNAWCELLKCYR